MLLALRQAGCYPRSIWGGAGPALSAAAGRLVRPRSVHLFPDIRHVPALTHLQVARTLSERISQFAVVTLDSCAYAGTGNVLKVGARGRFGGVFAGNRYGDAEQLRVQGQGPTRSSACARGLCASCLEQVRCPFVQRSTPGNWSNGVAT